METNIKELIHLRDSKYNEDTNAILDQLLNVTEAMESILELKGNIEPIVWNEVALTKHMITVTGNIRIEVGDTVVVTETGEEIQVTQDTKDFLSRVVSISLPMDLAETGSKFEIMEFIANQIEKQESDDNNESIVDREPTDEELTNIESEFSEHESDSFTIDELTDDQLNSLIICRNIKIDSSIH